MLDEMWYVLILWFITLVIGLNFRERFFVGLSAIIGIFLGFLTMTNVYVWLGLIFIFASLYLLYYSLFAMITKTKRG